MVSLRRRRLLGLRLCAGSAIVSPLPQILNVGSIALGSKSPSLHPLQIDDTKQPEDKSIARGQSIAPNASASSSSKDHHSQPHPGQPVKRRKRHRRKQVQNQEPCNMRGVYFKNMKWQAAIKVDKKQIHLGTVGSQEEAARLYDRAAFMCGREPNFELSDEEKRGLSKFKWEEFLAITRSTINSKKSKRKSVTVPHKKSEPELQNGDSDGKQGAQPFSGSEDMEPDSSASR